MNIRCNNCGSFKHSISECRNPITSYGVLLFKKEENENKILMINRKDSLCYIDFLRGKYSINNYKYIQILINKCSITEKQRLLNENFDNLWKSMWLIDKIDKKFINDYKKGKDKYDKLKKGYKLNDIEISLEFLIKNSDTKYVTPEWEFPKGRRNSNETNKNCAIREFTEETGYEIDDYELIINIIPFTENYLGENKIRYRHIYYIGNLLNHEKKLEIDKKNLEQYLEVSDIKWFTKEECLTIIRDYHITREKIIQKIFNFIDNSDDYILI